MTIKSPSGFPETCTFKFCTKLFTLFRVSFIYAGRACTHILYEMMDTMARIELEPLEMLRRKATKHGSSSHVYVPKKWIGQTVTVILEVANPSPRGKGRGEKGESSSSTK